MNDRFIVLKTIYENQVTIAENQFPSVTQEELANLAQFSKAKVNRLLNELMDDEYVIMFNGIKGRYQITKSGYDALKKHM